MEVFHDFTYYFDEPFADDSLIPQSLVAEMSRLFLGAMGATRSFMATQNTNGLECVFVNIESHIGFANY